MTGLLAEALKRWATRKLRAFWIGALVGCALLFQHSAAAEAIKIGLLKTTQNGPFFIALERGYFRSDALEATPVYFDAAQPVAVAVAAGSVDFGMAGTSAGFYSLAGQGVLRIIAGQSREIPGFPNNTVVASNSAYAGGLKSLRDLSGHSVAIGVVGGPPHYVIGVLAEKYGIDLRTLHLLPLQSLSNMESAIIGNQADASDMPISIALPIIKRGDAKLLAYMSDELRSQNGLVFTATRTANERRDTVERFLSAYRRGSRDYHDAIADEHDKPRDGPAMPDIVGILAKYVGQSSGEIRLGMPFADVDARLDVNDVRRQIDWYKSQNLLKSQVDADDLIDKRYVIPLPRH